MASDVLNSIIPWILLAIGIIWIWATFGEPLGRFFQWIKSFSSNSRERFQPATNVIKEFQYS